MRIDNPTLREGSALGNLTCPSGKDFPEKPNEGELFKLSGHVVLVNGLYSFEDGGWQLLAKVEPMVEVGTTYDLDVNTSSPVPIVWNRVYAIATSAFEVSGPNILVKVSGTYDIYYNISIESLTKNKAKTIGIYVRLAATGYIFNRSKSYQFTSDSSENDKSSVSVKFTTTLTAGEEVQLCGVRLGNDGQAFTIADNCSFGIRRIGK